MIEGLTSVQAMERARQLQQREARARAIVDCAVAIALQEAGEPEHRHSSDKRHAHDVAIAACSILLEQIYAGDRELAETRAQLEQLQQQALELTLLRNPTMIIRKDKP